MQTNAEQHGFGACVFPRLQKIRKTGLFAATAPASYDAETESQ